MTNYLAYTFEDTEDFIHTFDELPLWSAAFGQLLLKHLELRANQVVLDIGSGAGFPLLELAERLGNSCKLYGADPWKNANLRVKQKLKAYGITNVELLEQSAENIPLRDDSVDLIVSNLGINNFEQPALVFNECHRILKPGGKLALTTNIHGHWKEFYKIFEDMLVELQKDRVLELLRQEQERRGNIISISKFYTDAGFKITRYYEEPFEMKFLDGSALLNHHFVKLGWLGAWKQVVKQDNMQELFAELEKRLNRHAAKNAGLLLTVPMLFIEGEKA